MAPLSGVLRPLCSSWHVRCQHNMHMDMQMHMHMHMHIMHIMHMHVEDT